MNLDPEQIQRECAEIVNQVENKSIYVDIESEENIEYMLSDDHYVELNK